MSNSFGPLGPTTAMTSLSTYRQYLIEQAVAKLRYSYLFPELYHLRHLEHSLPPRLQPERSMLDNHRHSITRVSTIYLALSLIGETSSTYLVFIVLSQALPLTF